MKHASLLIVLCVLFGFSSYAQSTTTVEKNAKRITITTKKVDENGKTVTETYIAEGDEPVKILEGMAISPDAIKKVEIINSTNQEKEERLFFYRNAGENVTIEGTLNEDVDRVIHVVDSENVKESKEGQVERVIIINSEGGKNAKECYKMITTNGTSARHASVWVNGKDKINCAALGVYAVNDGASGGAKISSLIEKGGAQAAGIIAGDIVTKIDEFEVNDFATLHLALSHFKPGDVVTVRYNREEKSRKTKVELKDWSQLPGHEWRSRSDCGEPAVITEEVIDLKQDVPSGPTSLKPLVLEEVKMYPNPTDGVFALSFNLQPGPLSLSITDINGKVVYNENNENTSGFYKREIDLKGVPQGNYILTVTQGDKVYTDQISKQ